MNALPPGVVGTVSSNEFVVNHVSIPEECDEVNQTRTAPADKRSNFKVPADIHAANYLQELANALSLQHNAECWIVVSSHEGRCRKIILSESKSPHAVRIDEEHIRSIALESRASQRPLLVGFPLEKLNSASAVLERVIQSQNCQALMALSLQFESIPAGIVIVLAWKVVENIDYHVINSMMSASETIVKRTEQWSLCDLGKKYLTLTNLFTEWSPAKKRIVLVAAVLVFLLMWIPLPYYPKRECKIQPASRTFVSSPIDGFLREAFVRPGDKVVADQLLARLDEQTIRRELSSAYAEYEAAQKRQDRALSTKAGGDLRIAQLEREQIGLKIQTLEENLSKLEARSLSAGIVVQGDWIGREGISVTTGQTLFEIAPLDRMTVEVHLLPDDLPWFTLGSQATLHSEASPGKSWEGNIERVDPSAEIEDQKAYFVAEFRVDNRDGLLRPGMKGLVRLHGGYRSIGWMLFRTPYQWLHHQWIW